MTTTLAHPAWLATARESATGWIARHGFPTRKHEDWKYLGLAPILDPAFRPAPNGGDHGLSAAVLGRLVPDLGGPRLVFVNGHVDAELSSAQAPPSGLTVTSVSSLLVADPARLEQLFAGVDGSHADGFAALNVALAEDGAVIDVAADTVVDQPIQLVFCTVGHDAALVSSPRSTVHVGPNSRVTIVETHIGIGDVRSCTNAVTEVNLAVGAHAAHLVVQNTPTTAFHLDALHVVQAANSTFSSQAFSLGAALARHEVRVVLAGEHAEVALAGLYLPAGDQYHDHPVLVEHVAPNCASTQRYNGVLDDRGHGVFNGRIVVHPTGAGTNASQSNRNLMLSDLAEIDTRPRLEIFADDVKCAHGATVGQLDPEAIHYLRTRGIDETTARGMLTYAFANEMVEQIELTPLREWIGQTVSARLHHAEVPA